MLDSDKFIEEGLKAIDQEIKEENDIREESKYISKQLIDNTKVTIIHENEYAEDIQERREEYELGIRCSYDKVILIALSKTKQRAIHEYNKTALQPKIYTPMQIMADITKDFTYEQTIEAVVSAFLLKLKGKFKAELLEE